MSRPPSSTGRSPEIHLAICKVAEALPPQAWAHAVRLLPAPRLPSTGEGFCRLSSSVCHSAVTSLTRSSRISSRSSRVRSDLHV